MKKLILFIILFNCLSFLKAQKSSLSECESILANYHYEKKNHTWKDFNYEANYGRIFLKEVDYINAQNPSQSKKYWLFKVENTGYFYFGNIHSKSDKPKFYTNEDDALVALFIWQCSKVYLDEGLASNQE